MHFQSPRQRRHRRRHPQATNPAGSVDAPIASLASSWRPRRRATDQRRLNEAHYGPLHPPRQATRHASVSPEWHLVKAYISELQRLTHQQWVLGFRRASPRVAAGQGENTGLFSGLEVAAAETQRGPKNRWKARVFAWP